MKVLPECIYGEDVSYVCVALGWYVCLAMAMLQILEKLAMYMYEIVCLYGSTLVLLCEIPVGLAVLYELCELGGLNGWLYFLLEFYARWAVFNDKEGSSRGDIGWLCVQALVKLERNAAS